MVLPLDGVRVVSLGVSISGPLGLRHLADFGAEVIKVEPPGGDMVRHWDSAVSGEGSAHFWVNPNKRSVQQFPPCPKDPIRPMPEGSPGASFGSQKPCVTLPSKREAKRGAIPCNVGFPFG